MRGSAGPEVERHDRDPAGDRRRSPGGDPSAPSPARSTAPSRGRGRPRPSTPTSRTSRPLRAPRRRQSAADPACPHRRAPCRRATRAPRCRRRRTSRPSSHCDATTQRDARVDRGLDDRAASARRTRPRPPVPAPGRAEIDHAAALPKAPATDGEPTRTRPRRRGHLRQPDSASTRRRHAQFEPRRSPSSPRPPFSTSQPPTRGADQLIPISCSLQRRLSAPTTSRRQGGAGTATRRGRKVVKAYHASRRRARRGGRIHEEGVGSARSAADRALRRDPNASTTRTTCRRARRASTAPTHGPPGAALEVFPEPRIAPSSAAGCSSPGLELRSRCPYPPRARVAARRRHRSRPA